jgi:hypothetical protein
MRPPLLLITVATGSPTLAADVFDELEREVGAFSQKPFYAT